MIVVSLVVVSLLVVWGRVRRARKQTLSGLNGERPVFSVEPPARRLGSRKGERL